VVTIDGPAFPDPSHIVAYLPDGARAKRMGWTAANPGWDGARYLEAAERALTTVDEAKRVGIWREVSGAMNADSPWIGIASVPYKFAGDAKIKGFDRATNQVTMLDVAVLSRE